VTPAISLTGVSRRYRPELVFADEPTGNLDSNASAEVLAFLRDSVREHGQSIVMVTHDLLGLAAASWPARRAARLDVLAAVATE
jgi:ABC-type lipoprotein export system ATPase subunit